MLIVRECACFNYNKLQGINQCEFSAMYLREQSL